MEQAIIIATITWLAVISPGADFAVVSRNSSLYGRGAGLASSAGIASGCWVHVTYAALGLALILKFIPDLFVYIQILGAAYLVYIGYTTIFSKTLNVNDIKNQSLNSHWRYYGTGFLTNSLNPKTSIFVISLYSQVIGAETPLIEQFLWGAFISLSHFLWFAAIARFMSSGKIRDRILSNQKIFNIVIGMALTALGILLFLNQDIVNL